MLRLVAVFSCVSERPAGEVSLAVDVKQLRGLLLVEGQRDLQEQSVLQ